jgi:hypothetical protein
MLYKKGKDIIWSDEKGNLITLEIIDWETPFGIEFYLKKTILNLKVPKNNQGYNVKSILSQISNDINQNFNSIPNSPLKNRGDDFLRIEVPDDFIITNPEEKPLKVSGNLYFKIYQYKGTYGIQVIIQS